MLFSQQFQLPDSGSHRIGTIGGEPYIELKGKQYQVGYMTPPRIGLMQIAPVAKNDPRIFDCKAEISGYGDRSLLDLDVPASVYVELPCSVVVTGPPGVSIILIAWEIHNVGADRGAAHSVLAGAGQAVPTWAKSVDIAAPGVATFKNTAGTIVGVVSGNVTNHSLPTGAAVVDFAGPGNAYLSFRQQG